MSQPYRINGGWGDTGFWIDISVTGPNKKATQRRYDIIVSRTKAQYWASGGFQS